MSGGGGQDRTCVEAIFVVVVVLVVTKILSRNDSFLFKSICGNPEPNPSLIIPGMVLETRSHWLSAAQGF